MPNDSPQERFRPETYTPGDLFKTKGTGVVTFNIPPFQRDFSWTEERWRDLWRDAARYAYSGRADQPQHFLGVVLLQDSADPVLASKVPLSVIDGQQRLLALSMLLAALRDEGWTSDINGGLIGTHLRWAGDNERTLAVLKEAWSGVYKAAFTGESSPLSEAYRYFRWQIRSGRPRKPDTWTTEVPPLVVRGEVKTEWPTPPKPQAAWDIDALATAVLDGFVLVAIHLPPEESEATGVFESLNGANTPLNEFDKVRVLMYSRSGGSQGTAYSNTWRPADQGLMSTTYTGKVKFVGDQFLYDYTVAHVQKFWPDSNPASSRTHEAIKEHATTVAGASRPSFVRNVLNPMAEAAETFPVAVGAGNALEYAVREWNLPEAAARSIRAINAYSTGPPTPLVLRILGDYWDKRPISSGDVLARLHLVEALLLRILLNERRLSPLRSEMIGVLRALPEKMTTSGIRENFRGVIGRFGVPSDNDLAIDVRDASLYTSISNRALSQMLRTFEHCQVRRVSNELPGGSSASSFTLEHIFPQPERVPASWAANYRTWGKSSRDLHDAHDLRHTLGNLILLKRADNSGFGQKTFAEKKRLLRDETEPLLMYRSVVSKQRWTVDQITERSTKIARYLLDHRPL
jgi:hypothetical protein